jgi:hypothetical protein
MQIASHILPKQCLYQLVSQAWPEEISLQSPSSFAIHLTVDLSGSDSGVKEFPCFIGVTDLPSGWDSALQKASPYSYLRIPLDPVHKVTLTAN